MTYSRRQVGSRIEPAHVNAPPRQRGDMSDWHPGKYRRPSLLRRLFRKA